MQLKNVGSVRNNTNNMHRMDHQSRGHMSVEQRMGGDQQRQLWQAVDDNDTHSLKCIIAECSNAAHLVSTPNLSWDGYNALLLSAARGNEDVVRILIESQPDVNTTVEGGGTALTIAAANGHDGVVRMLISMPECDVNHSYDGGRSALIWASMLGHSGVVDALIHAPRLEVNHQDKHGETALMHAAFLGHQYIVELLLMHPIVDIFLRDQKGINAKQKAKDQGHSRIVDMLEEAKTTARFSASSADVAHSRAVHQERHVQWLLNPRTHVFDRDRDTVNKSTLVKEDALFGMDGVVPLTELSVDDVCVLAKRLNLGVHVDTMRRKEVTGRKLDLCDTVHEMEEEIGMNLHADAKTLFNSVRRWRESGVSMQELQPESQGAAPSQQRQHAAVVDWNKESDPSVWN